MKKRYIGHIGIVIFTIIFQCLILASIVFEIISLHEYISAFILMFFSSFIGYILFLVIGIIAYNKIEFYEDKLIVKNFLPKKTFEMKYNETKFYLEQGKDIYICFKDNNNIFNMEYSKKRLSFLENELHLEVEYNDLIKPKK